MRLVSGLWSFMKSERSVYFPRLIQLQTERGLTPASPRYLQFTQRNMRHIAVAPNLHHKTFCFLIVISLHTYSPRFSGYFCTTYSLYFLNLCSSSQSESLDVCQQTSGGRWMEKRVHFYCSTPTPVQHVRIAIKTKIACILVM